MTKLAIIIFGFIAIIFGALVWAASQRPPARPAISLNFLGYTNDATGLRLARFALTNQSSSAMRRHPYSLEFSTPAGISNAFARAQWSGRSAVPTILNAGASETFTVPSPTNDCAWRMSLIVYPEAGPAQAIKVIGTDVLNRIGVKSRYRVMRYEIFGDWIEPAKDEKNE